MEGRWLLWALAPLLLACGQEPRDVYLGMVEAAREENVDRFLEGFVPESRGLVKGLIELTGVYSGDKKSPLSVIGRGEVVEEQDVPCHEDARYAVCRALTIRQGGSFRKLLFVQGDEGWGIDLRELDRYWEDRRNRRF